MNQIPGLFIAHTKHGRGVFTAQDIQSGEIIEVAPVITVPKFELPIIHKTHLHDYYFLWGEDLEELAIGLGFASLYNHQQNPNANFILDIPNKTIDFVCIRDIQAGEEITINYHGEPGNPEKLWF